MLLSNSDLVFAPTSSRHLALRDTPRGLVVENEALLTETATTLRCLVATVAHDINNPLAFVNTNLSALEQHVGDVSRLIALEDCVDRTVREAELAFLRKDLVVLLRETKDGLRRVANTVRELVHFSFAYRNTPGWQRVDLHGGLNSAISLVSSELKHGVSIRKDYEHDRVCEVECLPAELNLAFMNLLLCAARSLVGDGEIRITTEVEGGEILVEIAGRAPPVQRIPGQRSPEMRSTVPGARGFVLSHAVVGIHSGHIEVVAGPQENGFRVWLPIRQSGDWACTTAA